MNETNRDNIIDLMNENTSLKAQHAALVQALDQALVTAHIGTFEPGDDPVNAIKVLLDHSQSIGEYFERERIKDLLSALQAQLAAMK